MTEPVVRGWDPEVEMYTDACLAGIVGGFLVVQGEGEWREGIRVCVERSAMHGTMPEHLAPLVAMRLEAKVQQILTDACTREITDAWISGATPTPRNGDQGLS